MKEPKSGHNQIQSFIDFETTRGKIRFGLEGLRIFGELNGSKKYLTDEDGNLSGFDAINIVDGEIIRTTPLITTPVDTVYITEYGDGRNMVTVLTLQDFIVGVIPAAAAALAVGNILCAFPSAPGFHIEEAYYQALQLQLPGTPVNADLGLGSVVGSTAQALLSGVGATCEDRMTGQTNATAAAYGTLVKAMSRMPLTGISVNINSSVKNVFLNAAGTWNVDNAGNLLAQGIVVIKWTKMV